jgi:two-component system sensor histidine kinase KdpD
MPDGREWSVQADRTRSLLLSVGSVAVVTAAVYALRPFAPVLSLGVLYVIAVVVVAVACGLAYSIPVSIASMLTFNFLFLAPVHSFTLHDSSNWVALAVYLVTAVVVSELATRSRRLARKAVEAETLRQSDAVKTAILQAVSHDLRSPLTAIRAAGDGLASHTLDLTDADREQLVEAIRTEVRRLERLVENLLDLSRLEAGPARRRPELWTADTLIGNALDQIGVDAARVVVTLADDLPPTQVDGAHIERVLVNLLENALAYSSRGDRVELDATAAGETLLVRIRDHGPGVAGSDRERIFEPFERGTHGPHGSGLGLAIARGFAEANSGQLWLEEPVAGAGATFVLSLPAAPDRPLVPA